MVIPQLTAAGDLDTLEQIVHDRSLPEATRLGGLEGLSAMARADAEQRILKVAKDESFEQELRKAAWRASAARADCARKRPPGNP